jgi:hypothetical protein
VLALIFTLVLTCLPVDRATAVPVDVWIGLDESSRKLYVDTLAKIYFSRHSTCREVDIKYQREDGILIFSIECVVGCDTKI